MTEQNSYTRRRIEGKRGTNARPAFELFEDVCSEHSLRLCAFQKFLCRKQGVERIAPGDRFGASLLAIDDAEGSRDAVTGFLRFVTSLENGVPCRAHIVNNDDLG